MTNPQVQISRLHPIVVVVVVVDVVFVVVVVPNVDVVV